MARCGQRLCMPGYRGHGPSDTLRIVYGRTMKAVAAASASGNLCEAQELSDRARVFSEMRADQLEREVREWSL